MKNNINNFKQNTIFIGVVSLMVLIVTVLQLNIDKKIKLNFNKPYEQEYIVSSIKINNPREKRLKPLSDMSDEQIKALSELIKKQEKTAQSYNNNNNLKNKAYSMSDEECRNYIIAHESPDGGNSSSGKYIGYYQLTNSYFDGRYGGDGSYLVENQNVVAENYMLEQYGSWQEACYKKMLTGKW